MNEKKSVGKLPVNSRVTVDYRGEKPKVSFGYPDRDAKSQVNNSTPVVLGALFVSLIVMLFYIYFIVNLDTMKYIEPESCLSSISGNELNLYCIIEGEQVDMRYELEKGWGIGPLKSSPEYEIRYNLKNSLKQLFWSLSIIPLFIIIFISSSKVISLYFLKTKKGLESFPYLNKKLHNKNFSAIIKSRDVKGKEFELPLFSNIYLDYEASGDFSNQLQQIKIREHPFVKHTKKKGKKMTEKNIYLWKATFIFKEKPKNGQLEIFWT